MRTPTSRYRVICRLSALLLALSACTSPITATPTATATLQPSGTPALVIVYPSPGVDTPAPPSPPTANTAIPVLTADRPPAATAPIVIRHPVEPGDSLWGLAVQYGVPMAAIQLQNGLGASTIIKAGDVLEIPPPDAWEGASTYWVVYEVSSGDTLSEIAARYGLTLAELVSVNKLTAADFLMVGQTLILPLNAPAEVLVQAPTLTPTAVPRPSSTPPLNAAMPASTAIPTVGAPTVAPAPMPADIAAWPREVWRLMNETRAAYGLPPYAYNETLALAAQLHAEDCSQRGSCSHTGSDGSDIKTRVQRVGYTGSYAECWAVRASPQGVIDIWMNETPPNDPHRRTVLHTWFTEVGIGVAPGPWKGYYYVIADFGRPR